MLKLLTATAIAFGLTLTVKVNPTKAIMLTLYDGTSQPVTPNNYSPQYLEFGATGGTQTYIGTSQVTNLNTTDNIGTYGGYSNYNVTASASPSPPFFQVTPTTFVNPSFPTLDRTAGYTLIFTVQIVSQTNSSLDRAGFSVIALSNDKQGIEIGFRTSNIFAQETGFTAAEGVSGIDSLLGQLTTYELSVLGSGYTLSAGGTPLLTGSLRDYTTSTGFASAIYNTSNFIFLGDDTTSAQANINLQNVTIDASAVPFEFSPVAGLAILAGLGGLDWWWKQKQKTRK